MGTFNGYFQSGSMEWIIFLYLCNYMKWPIWSKILNACDVLLLLTKWCWIFYGTRIRDEATGELERHENWQRQYHNLNTHGHNNLRITRILKCLGEFGYENYKEAFMKFYISEMFEHGLIGNCAYSCENFWLGTLKNDELRTQLEKK